MSGVIKFFRLFFPILLQIMISEQNLENSPNPDLQVLATQIFFNSMAHKNNWCMEPISNVVMICKLSWQIIF